MQSSAQRQESLYLGQKILFFFNIFRLKFLYLEFLYLRVQTCEKSSRSTQNVSILELRMPDLCNFGL